LAQIRKSKLKIDTNPHVTIEHIKRTAIKQAQTEDGLDFIIIDYLQLISNEGKRSRQEEIADISRSLKILAKELNIPIMVLVQLNRERRGDEEDQTPKIYDIRESGAVAQDSNVVILIHRDMGEDDEVIDPKATFIIAKNRQGEANKYITVRTRLESSLFIDDNKKGQDLLRDLEFAVEQDGDYEINYESTAYLEGRDGLSDLDGIEDNLENLFSDDEDNFFDEGFFDKR
jgi:replicative DNA helicase